MALNINPHSTAIFATNWCPWTGNRSLPIRQDIEASNPTRLGSTKPPTGTARIRVEEIFSFINAWSEEWTAWQNYNMSYITHKPTGFDLQRSTWSTLNRIRTRPGKWPHFLHNWGKQPSPQCDCRTRPLTIWQKCPLRCYNGNPDAFLFPTPESINCINRLDIWL